MHALFLQEKRYPIDFQSENVGIPQALARHHDTSDPENVKRHSFI